MPQQIQVKTFEAEDTSSLDTAVNTFLATLNVKDVLEVLRSSFSSAKYGTNKTHTATVVYKEQVP